MAYRAHRSIPIHRLSRIRRWSTTAGCSRSRYPAVRKRKPSFRHLQKSRSLESRPPWASTRRKCSGSSAQHPLVLDEAHDRLQALAGLQVGEDEWTLMAHLLRVAVHHLKRRADHRREVDLVDDQQIALRDAGPAFARDLVARGDVDDIERQVGELRTEGGGEVVAAGLDQDQI